MLSRSILAKRALRPAFTAARAFSAGPNDVYLVTGAGGQVGSMVCQELLRQVGPERTIGTDLSDSKPDVVGDSIYYKLDIRDHQHFEEIVKKHKVTHIVHLAAVLSQRAEQPGGFELAYSVNVNGTKVVLDLAKDYDLTAFISTSIACFGGPNYQKVRAPVDSVLQPETVYGVTKVFNENLASYYHSKWGVNARCLRYPGIISSASYSYNGTVSYPTEMFLEGLATGHYDCYLKPDSHVPVIYIDDCVRATLGLTQAPQSSLKRCVYNLGGMPMTPAIFTKEAEKLIPGLTVGTKIDPLRQTIADSWPDSLDEATSAEWGWHYDQTPAQLAKVIFDNIDEKYKRNM